MMPFRLCKRGANRWMTFDIFHANLVDFVVFSTITTVVREDKMIASVHSGKIVLLVSQLCSILTFDEPSNS